MKNISFFLSENFQFLEMKFSIYLNKRVFIMILNSSSLVLSTVLCPEKGSPYFAFVLFIFLIPSGPLKSF